MSLTFWTIKSQVQQKLCMLFGIWILQHGVTQPVNWSNTLSSDINIIRKVITPAFKILSNHVFQPPQVIQGTQIKILWICWHSKGEVAWVWALEHPSKNHNLAYLIYCDLWLTNMINDHNLFPNSFSSAPAFLRPQLKQICMCCALRGSVNHWRSIHFLCGIVWYCIVVLKELCIVISPGGKVAVLNKIKQHCHDSRSDLIHSLWVGRWVPDQEQQRAK